MVDKEETMYLLALLKKKQQQNRKSSPEAQKMPVVGQEAAGSLERWSGLNSSSADI